MQLSTKVFIGFALGIILGLIFKEQILIIKPLGDLFLRLIKMIVVPLVFFSIISGITSMGDIQKLRKVGVKTLLYYFITTGIAGIIGIIVARTLKPGTEFVLDQVAKGSVEMKAVPKLSEVILNMVPTNPFASLVSGDLIQVIVFSIFLGIGITIAGKKAERLKEIFDAGSQAMYKVTNIVMEFSPIGVTALIAASVGEYGIKIFGPLGKFILTDYVALLAILFILYSLMLKFIAKVSLKDFYRIMPKIWAVTASTTSSSGTLPVSIKITEEDFNVKEELASFTLPLGATMNMNGAVAYFAAATIFIAQIYGIELSIAQQAMLILTTTLISVGAPGIPGGGIVLTVMLLGTMGLPADIVGLIAGVYRIIDMGHTSLNVTGDVVSTLCIARSEGMFKSNDQRQEKTEII